jgi:hypothetical protein
LHILSVVGKITLEKEFTRYGGGHLMIFSGDVTDNRLVKPETDPYAMWGASDQREPNATNLRRVSSIP